MNRIAYSTSTSQANMARTGRAGMLAVAAATFKPSPAQVEVPAYDLSYMDYVEGYPECTTEAGASTSTCPMHNCAMPVWFKQAEGEAPGVGRWMHVDPRLDPSPVTGRGHVVPAGVK